MNECELDMRWWEKGGTALVYRAITAETKSNQTKADLSSTK